MQLLPLFSSKKRVIKRRAKELYANVLKGALHPQLYENVLAEDTFDGRFEQVALHGALILRVLRAREEMDTAKALVDAIFAGLDHAYRETGVGDSSISRKVRKLGERFYGLARGLDQALKAGDAHSLDAFVSRNGLGQTEKDRLVCYLRRADKALSDEKELTMAIWPDVAPK